MIIRLFSLSSSKSLSYTCLRPPSFLPHSLFFSSLFGFLCWLITLHHHFLVTCVCLIPLPLCTFFCFYFLLASDAIFKQISTVCLCNRSPILFRPRLLLPVTSFSTLPPNSPFIHFSVVDFIRSLFSFTLLPSTPSLPFPASLLLCFPFLKNLPSLSGSVLSSSFLSFFLLHFVKRNDDRRHRDNE